MREHPVQQPIRAITAYIGADREAIEYAVGVAEVTLIEACTKPGLHCDIPYVRVWSGFVCEAEFCQHNIIGVYYEAAPLPASPSENASDECVLCRKPNDACDCVPF